MIRLRYVALLSVVVLFGVGFWLYQRPLPIVQAEVIIPQTPTSTSIKLPWPAYGQAAFGAAGFGVLERNNTSKPAPIASIAKAITALAILKEKPLQLGQQGPLITIAEADVQLYADYLAKDGSVLPVSVGQQISQYQALQAMMLPSANNIADTAVSWAFGSAEDYTNYANQFVRNLGMKQTAVADASGFSPKTVSTAEDLVILGEAVLENPVLSGIVKQSEATFPGVGLIKNVNWLLGTDGILGIKTGQTDEAGGCYLFGAKRTVAGQSVTVIGVILGAPTRNVAMEHSRTLIQAADSGFEVVTAVRANQIIGNYSLPWGGTVSAVATGELKVLNWKGDTVVTDTNLSDLTVPNAQNSVVGSVKAGHEAKSVSAVLSQQAPAPSWTWRIFR
ncbi:D-alanyl-D-alanine carboxypeptidase [Candidatus Saccharibacteria bacterium]|nr:D-alanyl-D-alanine carboxypeptidase [Candidatus Saccharibacteria bacterium]MBI2285567.1 D-alanyl-D-alanine carboxypeptidase [Candidatus Saccharibacteria bacterium]